MAVSAPLAKEFGDSGRRYQQLVSGTKGFLFRVETENGRAARTIHYPGVEQVTGYTPEDYGADPFLWLAMIPFDDRPLVLNQVEHALAGEDTEPIEHRIRRKDGAVRWVRNTSVTMHDPNGRIIGYEGLIFDITDQKRVETEREALFRDLERSNADWEQFAYIAFHDLQEPLRMIASYVQLLQKRYQGQLDDKADQFIEYAVTGAKRMQALLDDLLHYSRAGAHLEVLDAVNVRMVVNDAIANLTMAIADSHGQIRIADELPCVRGDPIQLQQVFQNLISNALKFRCEGVPPEVFISAGIENHALVFTVQDHGIGIAPQHRERLFQIFQRLHPRDKYPGRGIGLAICKRIIERHGGRIWVESEPGKGAMFRFCLPTSPCDERSAA